MLRLWCSDCCDCVIKHGISLTLQMSLCCLFKDGQGAKKPSSSLEGKRPLIISKECHLHKRDERWQFYLQRRCLLNKAMCHVAQMPGREQITCSCPVLIISVWIIDGMHLESEAKTDVPVPGPQTLFVYCSPALRSI